MVTLTRRELMLIAIAVVDLINRAQTLYTVIGFKADIFLGLHTYQACFIHIQRGR